MAVSAAAKLRSRLEELIRPTASSVDGRALWVLERTAVTVLIVVTNIIGAAAVLTLALFVLPLPTVPDQGHVRLVNGFVAAGYVALAVPVGAYFGTRRLRRLREWLTDGRAANAEEQRAVLLAPLRLFTLQVGLWLGAAVVFGILNLTYSGRLALWVSSAIVLSGLTTAACAYLLSERALRPIAARALGEGAEPPLPGPGVATRFLLAWGLGTAIPVVGVLIVGVAFLAGTDATGSDLAIAMVVLGGGALIVGLLAILLAARATVAPVNAVRHALTEVRDGEFDVQVPVYDGTQIGDLQLGFNQMVHGLSERQRIREALGAYVDPDVAEQILKEGTDLAGEKVNVTVLFVDVCDFTAFAESRSADEVVAALNRLFENIVPIVHERGGRVDKFTGDGLLAVFGAPRRLEDHADRALDAARAIQAATEEAGDFEIGVGINTGEVVAGNIGGGGRLEFSVIGDVVNVAARAEAATRETGDSILLTEMTKAALSNGDGNFQKRSGVSLKGKAEEVALYGCES